MPNTHSTLTSLFSDIADAIRGKTGSSATIVADDFPTAIASIPTGGGSATIQPLSVTTNGTYTAPTGVDGYSPITVNVPKNAVTTTEVPNSTGTTLYINSTGSGDDVRFIDYDGTVLHTYSASEFANLTEMPANPTHAGLTSQGWNWTLADAKAQVTAMGSCDIGQMYITDDGKTRVYINLTDSARLSPYLGICPNGTVVVDWGDNTATDTLTGTSLTTVVRVQHTYASTGDYVITLTVSSGSFQISGTATSTSGSHLLTRTNGNIASQRCYQNAIKKVELGANASLGNHAFHYCYSLESVTIPSSLTYISTYTFSSCYSLTSVVIPSGVASTGGSTFSSCCSLTSITIPSSVMSIGANAFQSCTALERITIPSGVTNISTGAFQDCSTLESITIPSGITSISASAFQGCRNFISITIPSNVTSIGSSAFSGCYSLTSITIPSGVTSIGGGAFSSCYALESITIPSGITSIGDNVFSSCFTLESITIPSGVTIIDSGAFSLCYSLSSITIPSGVTSIGSLAFGSCYSLSSITIPSGVTSIGNAFQNCYGVAEYHFLPTTPPTLSNTTAFMGILADCKIYVPAASLTAYQEATNWSTYASYMVGE